MIIPQDPRSLQMVATNHHDIIAAQQQAALQQAVERRVAELELQNDMSRAARLALLAPAQGATAHPADKSSPAWNKLKVAVGVAVAVGSAVAVAVTFFAPYMEDLLEDDMEDLRTRLDIYEAGHAAALDTIKLLNASLNERAELYEAKLDAVNASVHDRVDGLTVDTVDCIWSLGARDPSGGFWAHMRNPSVWDNSVGDGYLRYPVHYEENACGRGFEQRNTRWAVDQGNHAYARVEAECCKLSVVG